MAYGVRSHDPLNGPVNTQVAVLASALRGRAPELAGQLAGRIIEQIDSYAEGGPTGVRLGIGPAGVRRGVLGVR